MSKSPILGSSFFRLSLGLSGRPTQQLRQRPNISSLLTELRPRKYSTIRTSRQKKTSKPAPQENPYTDPLDKLAPYLLAPIVEDADVLFKPSVKEMQDAEKLFGVDVAHTAVTHKGFVNLKDIPDHSLPEIAFIGQSNVGKSSLIQALFDDIPGINVSISKHPGHTKVIKGFSLLKKFSLVDMPGYGYKMPHYFEDSMEQYLRTRRNIANVILLLDAAEGLSETDRVAVEMMEEFSKPYTLVFTKIDLVTPHLLIKNILKSLKIRDEMAACCFPQPFLLSSKSKEGLALLKTYIAYITGNINLKGL